MADKSYQIDKAKDFSVAGDPFYMETECTISFGSRIDRRSVMHSGDTATLSPKFQIVIPKAVRTARQWRAGQEFAFIPKGEGVLLVPVPDRDTLAGLVRGANAKDYRDRTDRF